MPAFYDDLPGGSAVLALHCVRMTYENAVVRCCTGLRWTGIVDVERRAENVVLQRGLRALERALAHQQHRPDLPADARSWPPLHRGWHAISSRTSDPLHLRASQLDAPRLAAPGRRRAAC